MISAGDDVIILHEQRCDVTYAGAVPRRFKKEKGASYSITNPGL